MDDPNAPHSGPQPLGADGPASVRAATPLRDRFGPVGDTIIHAAHEAILTIDHEQRIVMANPAAQRMFGYAGAELIGSPLSRLMPPQYRARHAQHVHSFAESGTIEREMGDRAIVTGLRANGEQFPAAVTICQLDVASELGTRRFFAALVYDMSERTALQSELADVSRRMQMVFERAPIAIWIIDGECITYANFTSAALFGVATPGQLLGRSIYALLDPESHGPMRQAVAQALAGESVVPIVRERIVQPDGSVRNVELAVAALPDHGRTALQMAITDITRQTEERRALELSRQQLRDLSADLVDAREEERRRIARELHDELGQRLTALKMELSSLAPKPAAPAERLNAMLHMVDETIASVRRIATELRPLMLDDLGLNAALEWLANGWARRMGVEVGLDLCGDDPPLDQGTSIALYRMVQEALTNVARHARATAVRIALERQAGQLVLSVRDDGVGFSELSMFNAGSHGLMGIRERAYMLGGTLEIGNSTSGGGRVVVRLPLEQPEERRRARPAP